jgi:hypothetical protein
LQRSEQPKSLGVSSGEYDCRMMTGIAVCGSIRYRDAETTAPATCRSVSSELHLATSAKLALRNGLQRSVQAARTHGAPKRQCQIIPGTF